MELGRIGVWSRELRHHPDRGAVTDAAAELEDLGYSALFMPGGTGGNVLEAAAELLSATRSLIVATAVLNVWMHAPADVASVVGRLEQNHRLALGLGAGHAARVDRHAPGRYTRPLATMRAYLDALDAAEPPVPRDRRLLGALGPRMLELARDRSAGTHSLSRSGRTHASGTRGARPQSRAGTRAGGSPGCRSGAREGGGPAARRPIPEAAELHTNNLLTLGLGDEDLRRGGSDRLVDALVAWGDEQAVADRVAAHLAAGADHVCIQVIGHAGELPRDAWRRLAAALMT